MNFCATIENGLSQEVKIKADKVIAADGVNSRVRQTMLSLDDF